MKKIMILLSALALTFSLSLAESDDTNGTSAEKPAMKCAEGKCGQGKCG